MVDLKKKFALGSLHPDEDVSGVMVGQAVYSYKQGLNNTL
jgi:hypothetical protein